MHGFFRLHPNLRHAIVHELGWQGLRPVQSQAIDAILDGCNVVVLAPTAGGKTEASLFPVLSRILTEAAAPVAALYVCPIRALLNNQEARIQRYARMVGLDAFKWHGDVAASARKRFLREPCHVLMITPESLEVMLISQRIDAQQLFQGLSAVIVDEVHAFAGDDRGAHLVSLLERLTHFCGRDLQRIGLSATVGNPDRIGAWLRGSSGRAYRRVDPPREAASRSLQIDFVENTEAAAREAARLGLGKKSLVFVESRSQAERIAAAMTGRGLEVFIHHSAVSRADRCRAEEQFMHGQNTAIVCTSTLELGIDVGDLDQVIQLDAPSSVASLLQRLGRTGRRPGSTANATLVCRSSEALIQAVALLQLLEKGAVEDVRPVRRAAHVLVHQLLALTLQEGGISRHRVLPWVMAASPFQDLGPADLKHLVDTMLSREILYEADGQLSLGREGEKLFGWRNFFELYAVFSSPQLLRVQHHGVEVGTVQASFLCGEAQTEGPLCFRLAGRAWQVSHVDWKKGLCQVRPAEQGRVPTWLGLPSMLPPRLCAEMKGVLAHGLIHPWLSPAARLELEAVREDYHGLVTPAEAPFEVLGDTVVWHTFAGAAINRLLAEGLRITLGKRWSAGNLSLKCREQIGITEVERGAAALRDIDWQAVAEAQVLSARPVTVSKFEPCLPEPLVARLWVERLFDPAGTHMFLQEHTFPIVVT